MLWLGVAYLGALAALFITSLWTPERLHRRDRAGLDARQLPGPVHHRRSTARSRCARSAIAALVTVDRRGAGASRSRSTWPRSPRRGSQRLLVIAVLMPLWASYLVKAYAWRGMLSEGGLISWLVAPFGLGSPGLRAGRDHDHAGLPVAAVHDPAGLRRPASGCPTRCSRPPPTSARPRGRRCAGWCCRWRSRRSSPGRSSRSRCRWATTSRCGSSAARASCSATSSTTTSGAANNLPFAAAVATIPVVVMLVYLAAVRRTGALENL